MTERKTIYLDDAMLKIAKVDKNKYADMSDFHDACVDCLKNLPSADRPKGRWIEYDTENERYSDIRCSCCQRLFTVDSYHFTDIGFTKDDLNFCPNCGSYNGGVQSEID